jgi:hypothetical protein
MCLHKSFENVTLKTGDWGGNPPELSYCDGSRNHGCDGCFCRHPDYHPAQNGRCKRCGKFLFDLLDLLWEIRQQVYTTKKFKYLDWNDLFNMEIAIEERLINTMCWLYNKSRDSLWKWAQDLGITVSPTMARSEMLQIFKLKAEEITADVIEEAKEQGRIKYDLDVQSSSEDSGYESAASIPAAAARNDCDESGACWTIVNIETGESSEQLNKCRRHDSPPSSLAGK